MERRSVLAGFTAVPLLSVIGREPVHDLDNCKGAADVHRREAAETAARLALWAGITAGNLGKSREAQRYYAHARRHATAARDTELTAWSYASEANLPLWDPHWQGESTAPTLIALGRSALGKRKAPVGEDLHLKEAVALARLGDDRGATDAVITAATHSDSAGLELRPFAPVALAKYSGEVFALLGMTGEANAANREARSILPGSLAVDRTQTLLVDAITVARSGNVLDGADMGRSALASLSTSRHTAGTRYRVHTLERLSGQRLTAA